MEFDDRDPCDVQWVNLTDSSVFQSVYINTGLVWARRSLKASGRNSVVGWPARVSCSLTICNYLVFKMSFIIVNNYAIDDYSIGCKGLVANRNPEK